MFCQNITLPYLAKNRTSGRAIYFLLHKKRTTQTAWFLMARPEGLEPPSFWFVARHSIQLSYERMLVNGCCR